jgi:hypothetical protein
MCWVAFERTIRIAYQYGLPAARRDEQERSELPLRVEKGRVVERHSIDLEFVKACSDKN